MFARWLCLRLRTGARLARFGRARIGCGTLLHGTFRTRGTWRLFLLRTLLLRAIAGLCLLLLLLWLLRHAGSVGVGTLLILLRSTFVAARLLLTIAWLAIALRPAALLLRRTRRLRAASRCSCSRCRLRLRAKNAQEARDDTRRRLWNRLGADGWDECSARDDRLAFLGFRFTHRGRTNRLHLGDRRHGNVEVRASQRMGCELACRADSLVVPTRRSVRFRADG